MDFNTKDNMKYLLIDGNNLGVRCSFANSSLRSKDDLPSGVHYGTFNSLFSLKQYFPDYQFFIAWDGKSKKRMAEAREAVNRGIVPSGYKDNREKDLEKMRPELKDFYQQAPFLQRAINELGIPQIRWQDFEADDIIASYVKLLSKDNEIVIVTSDEDYFQLLKYDVSIWDGRKQKTTTKKTWEDETGITSHQHIDVGALMGDDGDNIFGVPGIGDKTAIKEIKKYGTWQKVLEAYKAKFSDARKSFPDLKDPLLIKDGYDPKQVFEDMKNKKSEKGKFIYPEINFNMPYTGVLSAFDKEILKVKASKTEIMALMFEERIRLAYTLKKMDEDIPNLPEINKLSFNKDRVLEYFKYYDINTLDESIYLFE